VAKWVTYFSDYWVFTYKKAFYWNVNYVFVKTKEDNLSIIRFII
jgi:hypothetical protein